MKVLHVSEVVLAGIATYLDELLQWQGRHMGKENVSLLLPDEHVEKLADATRQAVTLIPYRRTGRNPASILRLTATLRKQVATQQPDIVHAHSSFAGVVARLPGISRTAKIVFTPNGWSFDREDGVLAQRGYKQAERLLAKRTDAIISCSEYETKAAEAVGIPRTRMHIIPHGVSESRLVSEAQLNADLAAAPRQGPLELLYVGRLDEQKGFDWLLKVIQSVPESLLNLTVVGSQIFNSNLDIPQLNNVCYKGWVNQSELDAYIDVCDAVIMPSRWEGFPFVILETLRRGRPLLVSNRGALPEMIGNGEAGYVFSLGQPQQLKQLLGQLSRSQLNDLRSSAWQRFVDFYSSEAMNETTRQLYVKILADPKPSCRHAAF